MSLYYKLDDLNKRKNIVPVEIAVAVDGGFVDDWIEVFDLAAAETDKLFANYQYSTFRAYLSSIICIITLFK